MTDERTVDELAIQIGARIRAFREEHGLTQTDLAERTNIPRQQIGRYEAGFEAPSLRTAIVLARFMDILVDELVNGNQHDDIGLGDPVLGELFRIICRMSAACRRAAAELLHMFILSRQNDVRETQRSR